MPKSRPKGLVEWLLKIRNEALRDQRPHCDDYHPHTATQGCFPTTEPNDTKKIKLAAAAETLIDAIRDDRC